MAASPSSVRARPDYRSINAALRYEMFSVFRVTPGALGDRRSEAAAEARAFFDGLVATGVTVRGLYQVAGLRANADWMMWTHADKLEELQGAYNELRRACALGRASTPVWSCAALHRPAEFNKTHVPAFLAGEQPGAYVCVYPFVRSYDWYLLPESDRRTMLADHGKQARDYPDVRANTMAAFALGDYEWILAFEAQEMHRIVDLMRELRATEARRHVREEVPFFAGPRVSAEQLIASLP
jgi:hydrogen peroxide-dependent heme synthase